MTVFGGLCGNADVKSSERSVIDVRVALFCHAAEELSEQDKQKELERQYSLLEHYAQEHGLAIEYAFFHTGGFNFNEPDDILLHLFQCVQIGEFDLILVECRECLPIMEMDPIPPIRVFLLNENRELTFGSSDDCILTEKILPGYRAKAYYPSRKSGVSLNLQ